MAFEFEQTDDSLNGQDPVLDPSLDDQDQGIAVGGIGDFVRMLLVLVLVVVLIYLSLGFLKRMQRPAVSESSLIQIAASQSLSGNRSLHLVQVGQQVFLVSEAESGTQLISEITEKESLDEIRLRAPAEQKTAGKSFSEILGSMLGSGKRSASDADAIIDQESPSLDFLQKRRERLKDL
ncbi:flagellar biosynthetic protein FliO [Spirochaeta dissipatitropha]